MHLYDTFRYIVSPATDKDCKPEMIMENVYNTPESLENKLVIWDQRTHGYRVYHNPIEYLDNFDEIPEELRTHHEVISGRQKLKFDIDVSAEKLNQWVIPDYECDLLADILAEYGIGESINRQKFTNIFAVILNAIVDTFMITYGRELAKTNRVICESFDETEQKFSSHIIINGFYVSNNQQAEEFTRLVLCNLPRCYRDFLDINVNKRLQNFRLVGNHKPPEIDDQSKNIRTKIIKSKHYPVDTLITYVNKCELLPDIVVNKAKINYEQTQLHPKDLEQVLAICENDGITNHSSYKFTRSGILLFERFAASDCEFCNREHVKDNTIMVTVSIDAYITVFKQCRRYLKERGKDGNHFAIIGKFPSEMAPAAKNSGAKGGTKGSNIGPSWVDFKIEHYIDSDLSLPKTLFDIDDISKNIYESKNLHDFEHVDTLVVKAAMKMGKTNKLMDYIAKYHQDGLRKSIIRFVSFRQTFSSNIKDRFPEFVLYSDIKGMLVAAKVIVQVESLHRLQINAEPPDLLILDECESIFEQFNSGLLRGNFADCFAKFQYLLRFSKHVICMDANVGDRTYRMLSQMRPGKQLHYHHNIYKNGRDDAYYFTGDKGAWLVELEAAIEFGEKVAVPMSSLCEAKAVYANLSAKFPEKTIKIYSAETLTSEKKVHFADVNNYWRVDILIYTPTVSAGVSFEQKHFDKIFGYFVDKSCPVETCIQMIGRIRDVATKQHFICINAAGNNQPTTIDEIRDSLLDKRARLFEGTASPIHIEYDENGRLKQHEGPYFQLWAENVRMQNLSKNSFIHRFMCYINDIGALIIHMQNDDFVAKNQKLKDQAIAKKAAAKSRAMAIAAIDDAPNDVMTEILNKISAQEDITETEQSQYIRYKLRIDYKYNHDITAEFILKYDDVKIRRIYKNLCRIGDFADETLANLQNLEAANHTVLMEMGAVHQDISYKYVYDQHYYAITLVKFLGWAAPNDVRCRTINDVTESFDKNFAAYKRAIDTACIEFGVKRPQYHSVSSAIIAINIIIDIMYGNKIILKDGVYLIKQCEYFTKSAVISERKHVPILG